MQTEKMLVRTEAVYSDDRTRRYLLLREWDAKKPKALIIMTNPSTAGTIALDFTTMYILNNITQLGYGSVTIANLVSKMTLRLNAKDDLTAEDENFDQIIKAAQKADRVIIAWGKIGENSFKVRESGFHPLAPQIRSNWILNQYKIPEPVKVQEAQPKAKSKRKAKAQEVKTEPDKTGMSEEPAQPTENPAEVTKKEEAK